MYVDFRIRICESIIKKAQDLWIYFFRNIIIYWHKDGSRKNSHEGETNQISWKKLYWTKTGFSF